MEYLMTYGWALLVIVIVIAVLIYINPFRAPEQCVFDQAGFLCQKPILQVSGAAASGTVSSPMSTPGSLGLFHATLINGERKTVVIDHILCIRGRTAPSGDVSTWPSYTEVTRTLGYQEQIDDIGAVADDSGNYHSVSCVDVGKDSNGYALMPTSASIVLRPNEDFSGRLYVAYKYSDDPNTMPSKVVGANLVTRAQ